MTKNIIRKTVAIITAVTMWASIAGPALAITAAELQAQINTLMAQLATLQTQLSALQGTGTGAVSCTITSFTQNLKQGMSGDDVKCLQIVLNSDTSTQLADSGVGSSGNETLYFGPLTKAAVIKFQEKYASEVLASWGLTSGTGFVGSTTRTKLDTFLTDGGVTPPDDGEVGTAATVSLAVTTPAAGVTALNAQDVTFTKIKFTAGADAYTVTQIVVARGGVSADADISSIGIYDGTTRLGSLQALNYNTHKATFSSLSWEVPSYGVKYLTIKASIAVEGTAIVGDSIQLGIAVASDITATVTPAGTFPMMGNARTIAGISVGSLDVNIQTSPASNTNMLSGAVDQEIACWKFEASSTIGASQTGEGFTIHAINISHVGTASQGDLSNLILKVAGSQIGSAVAEIDASNQANFDLSASPLTLNSGTSKRVCAYADVTAGIWTERTIKFEITQYVDVTAYGSNSGGATIITSGGWNTYTRQTGNPMTIGQGTLTVALDAAENPSGQYYVKGSTNRLIVALKFSTASTEGVRIVKLRFTLGGSQSATDISNVTLWDGSTQIAGPASVIGNYVTFGANTIGWDTIGLFDMEPSTVKTIVVKADIPTGASSGNELVLSISSSADIWADGLDSQYDLSSSAISGSATGSTHTVSAFGSLAVSLASNSPAAQTYVKGSIGKVFAKINVSAGSGEDIVVSSITIRCYRSDGVGTDCEVGDTSNVKILKSDGTQYGSTVAGPIDSASFSGSLTIAAAQTETLSVVADVPTGSNATSAHWSLPGDGTIADDITSAGYSSGASFDETGSATGKMMTFGQGSLTISAAASPADQTLILGAAEVPFVGLVMTAGTGENIRVTRIVLKRSVATTTQGSSTDISNVALWEGTTRLTVKKGWDTVDDTEITFTASDFLNSSGIDISKGQQKVITVKGDIPTTGIAGHYVAIGIATSTDPGSSTTTEVTIVGLSSNTYPAPTIIKASSDLQGANYTETGHADAHYVLLHGAGNLTLARSADTPLEQIQSVSIEGIQIPGVSFLKTYLKSTLELIDMKTITIERKGSYSRDSDFASISLYDGDGNLIAAPQTLANASTTFNLVPDDGDGVWEQGEYWRIPTVGTKNLIVKATLNGISLITDTGGSNTGDVPILCIDSTDAEGVNSGISPTGAGVPTTAICSNVQIIRQGQPTIALASPTSGTYGAGQKELIRWTVSADAMSSITWKKIIFDVSGGIVLVTTGYTVGSSPAEVKTDGIYMSTTTTWGDDAAANVLLLIATSSMQVWDVNTNTRINASSSPDIIVDQATATGTARVSFVSATENEVGAGATKTYKLIGTIMTEGSAGSSLTTQINSRSIATTTDTYANVAATVATGDATLVWSDKSSGGEGIPHSKLTADWTNDYKVSGIPSATKTLSK